MSKKYVIYIDVCCLNRPYDNWIQSRIFLEAEAILEIISRCQLGDWELVNSTVLESEIAQTPDQTRVEQLLRCLAIADKKVLVTPQVTNRVIELKTFSFKSYDALHLACAEVERVDVFLTTDDRLLRKALKYKQNLKVQVANPVSWLMEVTTLIGEEL
jgi:predicted nucleic acid-binding protein